MSNYTKTTNFEVKDNLPTGNPSKIIRGSEIDSEFNAIQTSVATKADTSSPTFTGTVTMNTVNITGTASIGTIDGGSY